ncbi:unnamed protein product, partial [Amoebophrya sp. A120]|eukprot:GSA120T00003115001.1
MTTAPAATAKPWGLWNEIWFQGRKTLLVVLALSFVQGVLTNLARPVLLKLVVDASMDEATETSELVILLFVFAFILVAEGILIIRLRQLVCADFVRGLLAWIIPVVHLKVMRRTRNSGKINKSPSPTSTAKKPKPNTTATGTNELTLIGNDLLRVCDDLRIGVYGFAASLVGIASGLVGLVYFVGAPALVGVGFMAGYIVFSTFVSREVMAPIIKKETAIADGRLGTMREMVSGIQQVKYLTWEENYLQLLFDKRKRELREILRHRAYQ